MLENLNEMQIKAVKHKDGPLLILAGAGSGKTKVLTTRIAYLINNYNINPGNILAITFTNKAAGELKERISKLIGKTDLLATTFHSFGLKILRENYEKLGFTSSINIMDSDDSLTLIKKILKDLNLDSKMFSPYMIRNKISNNKSEFITPEDYSKFCYSEQDDVILKVYTKYQEILFKNNSVDFDDLLILPIKLFLNNEDVLEYYRDKYKYILIDEYQDTNHAQYLLTKMIASKHKNICVVGDSDQSIYAFRGANYRNILNFEKDYKNAVTIVLEQNYRSTKNILNAANSVIKNNDLRKEKNLWSDKEDGDKVIYYKAEDEIDEVNYSIREIKKLLDNNVELKDIAILYRTNAQSRVFENELLKQNIPFRIIGSFYFYQRKEIKDLLAYLKLLHNNKDDISLLRVINEPKRGIGLKTLEELQTKANMYNVSLYEAITDGKTLEFKNIIEELTKRVEDMTLTEFIDLVLDKTGMRKALENEKTLEADIRLENLEEFKSVTKTYEEKVGLVSLEDFLMEVSLVSDIEEYKDDPNRLTLMTVHQVKGLEFPYVFITGLEEGMFPHKNAETRDEIEEERRLMYVAITRAKQKLYLTSTKKRTIYGEDRICTVSRFINEIDKDLLDKVNNDKKLVVKREKNLYETNQEYNYGDKIEHDTYGIGIVIEVTNSLITVAFSNKYGIKKLLKNHKSIKKIN